jgi:hypothetical protein
MLQIHVISRDFSQLDDADARGKGGAGTVCLAWRILRPSWPAAFSVMTARSRGHT